MFGERGVELLNVDPSLLQTVFEFIDLRFCRVIVVLRFLMGLPFGL